MAAAAFTLAGTKLVRGSAHVVLRVPCTTLVPYKLLLAMEALWAALSGAVRPTLLQLCAPLDTVAEALGQDGVDPADPLANLRLALAMVLFVSGCEHHTLPSLAHFLIHN